MNLSQRVNVLAVDLPAHGKSKGKPLSSIEEMASFINQFVVMIVDQLQLQGEVIYVGHSLGGGIGIGIELGIQNPKWLKTLVLITTSAKLNVMEPSFLWSLKNGKMKLDFFERGFSPSSGKELISAILARQGETPIETCYYDFLAGDQFNRKSELDKITSKTLILSGKDDKIMQEGSSKLLSKKIKCSKLVEIENMGHFATLEKPEIIAKEIENFVL